MRYPDTSALVYNIRRRAFLTGDDNRAYRRDLVDALPYPVQAGTCLEPEDGEVYMLEERAIALVAAKDWANWRAYALLPRDVVDEACSSCSGALSQPFYRERLCVCSACGNTQEPGWVQFLPPEPSLFERPQRRSKAARKAQRKAARRRARRAKRRWAAVQQASGAVGRQSGDTPS